MNRRQFLIATGAAGLATVAASEQSTRLGLVRSTHSRLPHPARPDDPLTYRQVRDMVFRAIELGTPRAGSLEAKIKPGSWVVVKPNIVFLRPHPSYALGDITDFRVTRAVLEYVATRSSAGRVTIAEGGTYRHPKDTREDNVVTQAGHRVGAYQFDWGPDEFPGFDGSLGTMLQDFNQRYPEKKFDYVDLSYDAVRDASGAYRRIPVPLARNGTGAFGARPDYFVTNTITKCDFLIDVPVMKVHLQSGITCCLKNYVGTAPREAYAVPGAFHNANLHSQHSAGGRIDPFIVDLASFHPPDYCVVDGIRGLQSEEHSNSRDDQTIRSNLVFAGEDPVASDALAARLIGFNPHDMDFLHMAAQREMGTMDPSRIDVRGDEPDRDAHRWEKPRDWYGRCNREWTLLGPGGVPRKYSARFDTLELPDATGIAPAPGVTYRAAAAVRAEGHRRAFLWLGLRGHLSARLNGETVVNLSCETRYRVGQFQYPVELKPGLNRLEFEVRPIQGQAQLSVLLAGSLNDGDTAGGIEWQRA